MKKLALMTIAGMLIFSACQQQEEQTDGLPKKREVALSFDFTVNSGLSTRSGRPLYSSEAKQRVSDMRVYVFKKGSDGGTNADYIWISDEITDGTHSGFYQIPDFANTTDKGEQTATYKITTRLGNGSYKFLAVGFEDGGYNGTFSDFNWTKSTTNLDEAILSLKGTDADEVFAGISDAYTITTDITGIHADVILKRAVAGIFEYFTNIPYQVNFNGTQTQVKSVAIKVIKKG